MPSSVRKVGACPRQHPNSAVDGIFIRGTDLQQRVWREVRKVSFGETSTYSRIAEAIGAPRAIRAVAGACSRSSFAFAVPCHRVVPKGDATSRQRRDGRQYRWAD